MSKTVVKKNDIILFSNINTLRILIKRLFEYLILKRSEVKHISFQVVFYLRSSSVSMKKYFKLFTVGIILGAMAFISACAPKSQDSCGFVQNVYGERISWKGRVPIQMRIHESVPVQYHATIKKAAETWNQSFGKTVLVIDDNKLIQGPVLANKDTYNVIYFYNDWEAERPTEQARTSVYWIGDAIKEADIRINAKNFAYYDYTLKEKSSNKISLEALVIHEMGHVLGLKHKDTDQSVMATYLASQNDRVQIAETDKKSLSCEY